MQGFFAHNLPLSTAGLRAVHKRKPSVLILSTKVFLLSRYREFFD